MVNERKEKEMEKEIKKYKKELENKETEEMLKTIHKNHKRENEKIEYKRIMNKNIQKLNEIKAKKRETIILIIIFILLVLIGFWLVKVERENKEKRTKECAEKGLTTVERYTKEGDVYYQCKVA